MCKKERAGKNETEGRQAERHRQVDKQRDSM